MLNKKHSGLSTALSVAVAAVILGLAAWVILNKQYVYDQFNVWWYKPALDVVSISDRSGMSDKGRFYFYTSQPDIENSQDFNNNCVRQEVNSAILGCYTSQKIHIYNVTNTELDGIKEVTAAHETLHAAWERTNESDKSAVGDLLEAAFTKINDPKLNERMAYYSRTEPGERINELHSILGTEYPNLGGKLETYYSKYFTDRSKVVTLHTNYQSIFDGLKSQSDALAAKLAAQKELLDTKTKQYNAEAASISAGVTELKNSENSVDRSSKTQVDAYNAKRQSLLDRVDALDSLRSEINSETDEYNKGVLEYNKLVVSTNNLNKSLDSTLAPVPSL